MADSAAPSPVVLAEAEAENDKPVVLHQDGGQAWEQQSLSEAADAVDADEGVPEQPPVSQRTTHLAHDQFVQAVENGSPQQHLLKETPLRISPASMMAAGSGGPMAPVMPAVLGHRRSSREPRRLPAPISAVLGEQGPVAAGLAMAAFAAPCPMPATFDSTFSGRQASDLEGTVGLVSPLRGPAHAWPEGPRTPLPTRGGGVEDQLGADGSPPRSASPLPPIRVRSSSASAIFAAPGFAWHMPVKPTRSYTPPLQIVGEGVHVCALVLRGITLPQPLDPSDFFSQVECEDHIHSNSEVLSDVPVTLVTCSALCEVLVHVFVRSKRRTDDPSRAELVEFETAFPLDEVFQRVLPADEGELDFDLVRMGRYWSARLWESAGSGASVRFHCTISGKSSRRAQALRSCASLPVPAALDNDGGKNAPSNAARLRHL